MKAGRYPRRIFFMDVDQEFEQEKNSPEELSSPDAIPPGPSEDLMNWPTITDEMMMENKTITRPYTMVILKAGPNFSMSGAQKIIWEHGRRNLSMRAAGLMSMIFPVDDGGEVCGVGIFNADPEAIQRIMAQDPAVQAGIFTFGVHPTRSFPGDALPKPSVAQASHDQSQSSRPAMSHLGILFHYPKPEYREKMLNGFLSVAKIMNAQSGVEASTYEEVETGALVSVTRYESLEAIQAGFRAVAAAGINPDRESRPRELHRMVLIQGQD
jgi:hypothetical protein